MATSQVKGISIIKLAQKVVVFIGWKEKRESK